MMSTSAILNTSGAGHTSRWLKTRTSAARAGAARAAAPPLAILLAVLLADLSWCGCPGWSYWSWSRAGEAAAAVVAGAVLLAVCVRARVGSSVTAGVVVTPAARPAAAPAGAPVTLCPPREWRADTSPTTDGEPPRAARPPPDYFIADVADLTQYLQQYETTAAGGVRLSVLSGAPLPPYRVSASVVASDVSVVPALATPPAPAAAARRMRLWLAATVLLPLAAALRAGGGGPLAALYLTQFEEADERSYAARRVLQLAADAALSQYRGDGGGADWRVGRPCDAELLLRLGVSYLRAARVLPTDARATRAAGGGWTVRAGGTSLAGARGRDAACHTLLQLAAAETGAARAGRAHTNLSWVLGHDSVLTPLADALLARLPVAAH